MLLTLSRNRRLQFATALGCALLGLVMAPVEGQTSAQPGHFRKPLVGSWLTTYNVPAFLIPIPVLLSFTDEGIVIETDSSAPTPFGGSIGTLILSNGHGTWKPTGIDKFAYTYRKLLYDSTGIPFGLARTNGAVTTTPDGSQLQADVDIQFTDNNGNIIFSATGTVTGSRIEVETQ
jgi:hypothetical protein